MKTIISLSVFFIGIAIVSCGSIHMLDITTQQDYGARVGEVYLTKVNLQLGAVRINYNPNKIDYYFIRPLPGIGGAEITAKGHLPAGSKVKIKKVIQGDMLLERLTLYVAEILSTGPGKGKDVRIEGKVYTKSVIGGQETVTLHSDFFTKEEVGAPIRRK